MNARWEMRIYDDRGEVMADLMGEGPDFQEISARFFEEVRAAAMMLRSAVGVLEGDGLKVDVTVRRTIEGAEQ